MYLSANIRFLRKRKRLTQSSLAEILKISRSSINNYENGAVIPPVGLLIELSDFFNLSVDTLLRINLSKLSKSQLSVVEKGSDVFVKGNELRVLSTTVDSHNRENIELVSIKAKAGYITGFFDPEYISALPVFHLPFLSKERKYRTFQISGDSMLPIPDKSWVTAEFLQDFNDIKDGGLYVILTLNEGIVFKKVKNELKENGSLQLISTNPEFKPYRISINEIREVWKFVHYISSEVPELTTLEQLFNQIKNVKNDLIQIKRKL